MGRLAWGDGKVVIGVSEGDSDPRFRTLERPQDKDVEGLFAAIVPVVEELAAQARKKPRYDQHKRAPAATQQPKASPAAETKAAAKKTDTSKPQMGFGV
ncbi:MAG: hypothetical protein AAB502_02485 [Chloroflexota bacterium]